MPLVSMRQLLDHAAENGYGLPAFNVNNLEQVRAIMEAADETGSPVIMQGSAGARKYAGEAFLRRARTFPRGARVAETLVVSAHPPRPKNPRVSPSLFRLSREIPCPGVGPGRSGGPPAARRPGRWARNLRETFPRLQGRAEVRWLPAASS